MGSGIAGKRITLGLAESRDCRLKGCLRPRGVGGAYLAVIVNYCDSSETGLQYTIVLR